MSNRMEEEWRRGRGRNEREGSEGEKWRRGAIGCGGMGENGK